MSEEQGTYRCEEIELDPLPSAVECPHCKRIIGWCLEMDGVKVFKPTNLVTPNFRAWYCADCGERYHVKKITKAEGLIIVDKLEPCG